MNAEKWERLQKLFHLTAELPEDKQESVLEANCPDPGLRLEVLTLLRASKSIEEPSTPAFPRSKPPLSSIGPYTLLDCIGSGGMGSVYLVERSVAGIRQRAALKVLAPHAVGPAFVERFRREQHILASLDHPNITRMLDAGISDSGQPYLVMEFVEGRQLDTYCDSEKLGVRERLELFLEICTPVDHAHRNLVVHLDLKPSNILITHNRVPKLLRFRYFQAASSGWPVHQYSPRHALLCQSRATAQPTRHDCM